MVKLIFGCGYLGDRVAEKWRTQGHDVIAVTRSETRALEFERQGYQAIVADVTRAESLHGLPAASTVLYAVGCDHAAGATTFDTQVGGVRNVLTALSAYEQFIHISTTGVYGPAGGQWVDESTPPAPQREGGRAALAAEQVLAESRMASRSVILRLAGIYGPGRVPMLSDIAAGRPIGVPGSGYLNLIHVDDAAEVVLSAERLATRRQKMPNARKPVGTVAVPNLFCVSDGEPVRRVDFYAEVARQIDAPPPEFFEPAPNSARAQRALGNRRVRNAKMLRELQVSLTYPDYRAGLAAILRTAGS